MELHLSDLLGPHNAELPLQGQPNVVGGLDEASPLACFACEQGSVPDSGLCPQIPSSFQLLFLRLLLAASNRILSESDLINTGVYCRTRVWGMVDLEP